MIVTPYKTNPVVKGDSLFTVLDTYLPTLHERDIVVITSKIISITQGRIVKIEDSVDKKELIHRECERYLTHEAMPRYGFILTISHHMMIANAGIDESNGDGYYVLWPEHIEESTNAIWDYLRQKYSIKDLGIVITDSHSTMLRWGVTGIGLSWCGFTPLNRYIDTPDIFGRRFHSVNVNVIDGLAASAVFVMGEGNEQTPIAVIKEAHNVQFQDHHPTQSERDSIDISLEDDLYAPLLTSVDWQKGGKA